MRLDKALAHEKTLWTDAGETFMAAPGRGLGAKLVVPSAHHLAVAMADRPVLMQSIDDGHPRQRIAGFAQDVVTQEEGVLEMHHVRLQGEQEISVELGKGVLIAGRTVKPVEVGYISIEKVLVWVAVYRSKQCPLV